MCIWTTIARKSLKGLKCIWTLSLFLFSPSFYLSHFLFISLFSLSLFFFVLSLFFSPSFSLYIFALILSLSLYIFSLIPSLILFFIFISLSLSLFKDWCVILKIGTIKKNMYIFTKLSQIWHKVTVWRGLTMIVLSNLYNWLVCCRSQTDAHCKVLVKVYVLRVRFSKCYNLNHFMSRGRRYLSSLSS